MRRFVPAVTVGVVLVCSGCSLTAGSAPPATGTGAPATGSATASSTASASAVPLDDVPAPAPAEPTWTEDDAAGTRLLAADAVAAFAATGLDAQAWFAGLAPYLTPGAQAAFYGTDPAEVPVHSVLDASVSSPSPYLTEAVVTTDAGPYRVLLVRVGAGAPWLAERIEPAE
jgi:hypothetical protein